MKKPQTITLPAIIGLLSILAACSKMDDYRQFLGSGPIRYTGKIDTVMVHPGDGRIVLSLVLGSDPAVNKMKAYWNNGADSLEAPVTRQGTGKDTMDLVIGGLEEKIYNFTVYTFDALGHSSVGTSASGAAYGDIYRSTLVNRVLKTAEQSDSGGQLVLTWGEAAPGDAGTLIRYLDGAGQDVQVRVPATESVTRLSGYAAMGHWTYKTLYIPESAAADSFSAAADTMTFPAFERQVYKTQMQTYPLPTDIADGGYGWHLEYLWDGNYGTPGWATSPGMPQWYTLDLGESVKLSRFKTWQAPDRLYTLQGVKSFEIWGSNAPDPDGSWASWTKLLSGVSIKPSGLPNGQLSEEDKAYALAGEEYSFPEQTPAVRYIRIKVLDTWGGEDWSTMSEITFWTRQH